MKKKIKDKNHNCNKFIITLILQRVVKKIKHVTHSWGRNYQPLKFLGIKIAKPKTKFVACYFPIFPLQNKLAELMFSLVQFQLQYSLFLVNFLLSHSVELNVLYKKETTGTSVVESI